MAYLEGRERWVKHYASFHRILLVGDGDFSFALCLARSFGSGFNIIATSLDSYEVVINKYKNGYQNLQQLESLGATVVDGVDAKKMKYCRHLTNRKFDRIVFNFPHAGFHGREDNPELIKMHRDLLDGFFCCAVEMLQPCGEIHVSHKTTTPFSDWNIEELALRNSLMLLGIDVFKIEDYPGYQNKRGDGFEADNPFPLGACSTYKFVANPVMNKMNHDIIQLDLSYHQPRNHVNEFGWLIFNVCGLSMGEPGVAGCGGAVTDGDGVYRFVFSEPLGIMEYDEAELCAFKVALFWFLKLFGKKPVLMRSGSVTVVSWITNPYTRPMQLLKHFNEIDSMLNLVSQIRIEPIKREENCFAEYFANKAIHGRAFEAEI